MDAPGLTLPDAGQEALNLLGQTAAVSEVLLGDKLAAFQEAAEKANEFSARKQKSRCDRFIRRAYGHDSVE